MILKRLNIFETNSSSTNSLCIGSGTYTVPEKLTIVDLEASRNFYYSTIDERFSVMVYMCYSNPIRYSKLCNLMYKHGVKEIDDSIGTLIDIGEIDDSMDELEELFDETNEEDLLQFIFNNNSILEGEDDNY